MCLLIKFGNSHFAQCNILYFCRVKYTDFIYSIMKVFIDKNRAEKRRETIRKSLSSKEESIKLLRTAGIVTKAGNISPKYLHAGK